MDKINVDFFGVINSSSDFDVAATVGELRRSVSSTLSTDNFAIKIVFL